MLVLSLDKNGKPLNVHCAHVGRINAVEVHPREMLKPAVLFGAKSIYLCHNHPSGDPTPSDDDFLLTERMQNAAEIAGVRLAGHVVVSRDASGATVFSEMSEGVSRFHSLNVAGTPAPAGKGVAPGVEFRQIGKVGTGAGITSSHEAAAYVRGAMKSGQSRCVLFLDPQNRVVATHSATGPISAQSLMRMAIEANAGSIITAGPDGTPQIAEKRTAQMVGIPLLDHMDIQADGVVTSRLDRGVLKARRPFVGRLAKAGEQLRLLGASAPKPPPKVEGWQSIPKGKHGGYRRRTRGGYEYWYPKTGYQESEAGQGERMKDAVDRQESNAVPLMVAYGGGVDSTAVLVGLHQRGIRPDAILFADVGGENPATYAYLSMVNDWLQKVGFPSLTIVRRKPTVSRVSGETYRTLEQNCVTHSTLPSLAFGGRKACSQKWKHEPQEQWANNWEPARDAWDRGFKVTKLIGYSADPADRRRPDVPDDKKYHYQYPLRQWGWDRKKSVQAIESAGLPVPTKSACWFCPATKPQELREFVRNAPDIARRIVEMEAAAEPGMKQILGLWGKPVQGFRGATKKPGSMTEWIVGEQLLPEFKGQTVVDPWWTREGKQKPTNAEFKASDVVRLLQPTRPEDSPLERLSRLQVTGPAKRDKPTKRAQGEPPSGQTALALSRKVVDDLRKAFVWLNPRLVLIKARRKADPRQMGLFIGPRGGKWGDAKHTIPYREVEPLVTVRHGKPERDGEKIPPPPDMEWSTGQRLDTSGAAVYVIMIRAPGDPDRKPRSAGPGGRQADRTPHQTIKKRDVADIRSEISAHMADGKPRTFNAIGVELWDKTADIVGGTKAEDALWQLVEAGELEHTLKAPIRFRRTNK